MLASRSLQLLILGSGEAGDRDRAVQRREDIEFSGPDKLRGVAWSLLPWFPLSFSPNPTTSSLGTVQKSSIHNGPLLLESRLSSLFFHPQD